MKSRKSLTAEQRIVNRDRMREWRKAHPDYFKKRYQANKEQLNAYSRKYYLTHKLEHNEYQRAWYQRNKEALTAKKKKYYVDNPNITKERYAKLGKEANNKRHREDYQKHKTKRQAYNREYQRQYREKNRVLINDYQRLYGYYQRDEKNAVRQRTTST